MVHGHGSSLVYYRKDLLKKSGYDGPPKTWGELTQMTRKVLGESDTRLGFVFQGDQYEGGVCNGCEYIWGNGGNVLDPEDPTKVLIDSPQAIAGLATERAMITEGTSPEAVAVYQEDESAGAFLNGDAIFLRNWPYIYALVGTSDYPKLRTDQVGVSELPSADGRPGNGTVGDQPLYISATSKYPESAWEFIEFLTAPEQQKLRAIEAAYLPTRPHSTTTRRSRTAFPSSPSPAKPSNTPARAPSRPTTRTCPWRCRSSSTPRSKETRPLRRRHAP